MRMDSPGAIPRYHTRLFLNNHYSFLSLGFDGGNAGTLGPSQPRLAHPRDTVGLMFGHVVTLTPSFSFASSPASAGKPDKNQRRRKIPANATRPSSSTSVPGSGTVA